jgi:hypothetical protein
MNCQDISLAMDDRGIDALSDAQRREFDAHLAMCPDCDRDWDVHQRLAATRTPPLPENLHHSIRTSLLAAPGAGGRRSYGRMVIFGSMVALSAAAAMVAVQTMRTPKHAVQPAAAITMPELPAPMLASEPMAPAPAASTTERPEPSRGVEEKVPPVQQLPAVKQRTVRVQALQNQATGMAFTAVDALFTAFMSTVRGIPGLVLIAPDQAEAVGAPPAQLRLRMRGFGPLPDGKFSIELSLENLQADGSYRLETIVTPIGDIAPACAGSSLANGMQSCGSPAHVAAGLARIVEVRTSPASSSSPPDPLPYLLEKSSKAENRFGALLKLRELGRHGEPAAVRGAIDLAANAGDSKLRAMVWQYMLSARSPELVPALVEAVKQDPDPDVRLQAMTVLAVDYPDDPRMRAALEAAAQQDSRALVRAWARRGLNGEIGWNEYIASSLKDPRRPDAERIEALAFRLTEPRGLDLQAFLKQNDAMSALVDVLRRMEADSSAGNLPLLTNPRVTALDDPGITDLVLKRLEKLPRSGSASRIYILRDMLASHTDKSLIRAALEKISAEDPDPNLRKAAAGILGRQ